MNAQILLFGGVALAVILAWAFGHWGTAGIAAKVNAAKQVLQAAETKAGGAVGAIEQVVAHPIDALHSAEHAMAMKATAEAGKLIAYLSDKSPQQAQRAVLDQIEAAKNKGLDDLIAMLQKARQQ